MRYAALVALLRLALASPGDNLQAFEDCVYQCEEINCYLNAYHVLQSQYHDELQSLPDYEFRYYNPNWTFQLKLVMPWRLWLLGWSCALNCDYECQRIITHERIKNDEPILQFHGKWPFKRVWGIQEPALVVFSLGNWYVSYRGMKRLWAAYKDAKRIDVAASVTLMNAWIVACISAAAWIFSAIFHTRDFLVTEHLDYYFAGLTVLSSFHAGFIRAFRLHRPHRAWLRRLFSAACVAAYARHVYRLVTDWLYTYNMRANIAVGVMQTVLMASVCYSLYRQRSHALSHRQYVNPSRLLLPKQFTRSDHMFALYPLLLSGIVTCGMLLEVFDFPPIWDFFDAHLLWHLATIIPPYMGWYDWIVWDAYENVGLEEGKKKQS